MPNSHRALQKKAVEAIIHQMQQYLDLRYQQVRRINSKVELVWEDVAWQQMANLRKVLEGEKVHGPERLHVGETLLSDKKKRVQEFFMNKSQNCLLGEIVEEKETEGHRTHGAMEIHDMRSLFRAIDPNLESIVSMIQTFIWWDLLDAVDVARFQKKLGIFKVIESGDIPAEMIGYYQHELHSETPPSHEDILNHEAQMMADTVTSFKQRRAEEKPHKIIVAREMTQVDNPDQLVNALASQTTVLTSLKNGTPIDESMRGQFAQVLNVPEDQVTPEAAKTFLQNTIATNKKRLRNALFGVGSGLPYNFKQRQLEEIEKKFHEVVGNRANVPSKIVEKVPPSE